MNSVRQTLYLKYRPQRFADLVGQEVVAQTLRNAVRDGRLSHAYLFTGIRGTGKTSAARILARAINCERVEAGEPCGECPACLAIAGQRSLDVIEIDAATNRGIDEIRDLRERAQFLPSQYKTKVYIIDEAHMLTVDAGNAFLKTLEEPPEHACFILATTEPQRLAETVISRCQRFDFRRIPTEAMAAHLARVCDQEKVQVTADALALIAEAAAGSLRDALSLLDRLLGLADGELDRTAVQTGLGLADPHALVRLATALAGGQPAAAWEELRQLQAAGVEPRQMIRSLGALAKQFLWVELGGSSPVGAADPEPVPARPGFWLEVMTTAAAAGTELRRADDPWMSLEAMLLRLGQIGSGLDPAAPPASPVRATVPVQAAPSQPPRGTPSDLPQPSPEPDQASPRATVPAPDSDPGPPEPILDLAQPPVPAELVPAAAAEQISAIQRWPEILAWLRRENVPVRALLESGRPASHTDGVLTVEFDHNLDFHIGEMQRSGNREILQRACLEVLGEEVVVQVAKASAPDPGEPAQATEAEPEASALNQALSVFPGSRVTRLGTADKG